MAEKLIYVASRASVPLYPQTWRSLRAQGWPINSTWIDEAGPGETADMGDLWQRIEAEVRAACGVVLWAEAEDFPLKGAYIEVGMAIGMGKPVAVYTKHPFENRDYRPFGSWMNHPLVERCFSLQAAMLSVQRRTSDGVVVAHGLNSTPVEDQKPPNLSDNANGVKASDEAQKLIGERRRLGWSDEQITSELRYRGLPTDGVTGTQGETFSQHTPMPKDKP